MNKNKCQLVLDFKSEKSYYITAINKRKSPFFVGLWGYLLALRTLQEADFFVHIKINEPFWSAYKTYGWDDKVPGLGFNKNIIDTLVSMGEHAITVTVGKDPQKYRISPITIQNQAKKYNSIYKARYNTLLYVIPQNKLEKDSRD